MVQEVIGDLQRKIFVADLRGADWLFPNPFHTENLGLNCQMIRLRVDGGDAYYNLGAAALVDISGSAYRMAVFQASDNTMLADQSTWTYDAANNIIRGFLNLFTIPMIAAVGTTQVEAYFLAKIITAAEGTYIIRSNNFFVRYDPFATGSGSPLPQDEYLTAAQMDARYLKKVEDAGVPWTAMSPDGTKQMVIGLNDDGTFQSDLIP